MKRPRFKNRDAELERELRADLALEEEERREAGMTAEEAREAALRAFGNTTSIREQTREMWSWSWLESFLRELRMSARTFRRYPGFAAIVIVVMALGIGTNVALFAVVRGVLLKPLPFTEPDRLVMLSEVGAHGVSADAESLVSGGMYAEWKKQNQSFANLAIQRQIRVQLSGTSGQLPEKLYSALFSWDMLPTLGVQPALGRGFTAEDDRPGADGTVLLSWELWKRRFGGDAAVLNQTIELDARPFTVIGVMPAWFDFPDASTQLWTPVYHDEPDEGMESYSDHPFDVVGRLKPEVSASQAVADLSVISERVHREHSSDPYVLQSAQSKPLLEHIVGEIKKPLYVLLGASCCLLLIACLNVANLLVARAAARRKELAIRTALGGTRRRLIFERLTESLVLSATGGVVGLFLAYAAVRWLAATRHDLSRVGSVHMDGAVAAFTVGVIFLCALFSGLIAAMSSGDKGILGALHDGSRSSSGGAMRATLRKSLLTLEVGLTVVLLIGAGLLLKSYERLRSADMGCATQNVITMHLGLPDARYSTPAMRAGFYDALLERVRALPGVDAAGFVTSAPGQGYGRDLNFTIVEHPALPQGTGLTALARWADTQYFAAMQIPILRGRVFDDKRLDDAREVVVSQAFAKQFFAGEDPIEKHVLAGGRQSVIVGVVGDTRYAIGEAPRPMFYFQLDSGDENVGTLVVRSRRDTEQFAVPVQQIVAAMDPDLPVSDILTMNQILGESTLNQSFNTTLLVGFAALSLILAAAGLFGVMSYIAVQRTTEIGIRMALGAERGEVIRRMLVDGMGPAAIGLAAGLAASVGAGAVVRDLLYGVAPLDPSVYASVAAMLLGVAALACIVPAWRASRVDPVQALRGE